MSGPKGPSGCAPVLVVPTKNSIVTETISSVHLGFPNLLIGSRSTLGNGIVLNANKSLQSEPLTSRSSLFGAAHSVGDTVAYFPNLRSIALGEVYSSTPSLSVSDGGGIVQWSSFWMKC